MSRITIPITNGKGSQEVVDGTYNVTADVNGYDNTTLTPKTVTITPSTTTYTFQISATGTLTLNVTDTGTTSGTEIVGATFQLTDSTGNTIINEATTNEQGIATFSNVPYGNNIVLYYKQTASDSSHTFDNTVKSIAMNQQNTQVDIANPAAPVVNFTLTDANNNNLLINDGNLFLEN